MMYPSKRSGYKMQAAILPTTLVTRSRGTSQTLVSAGTCEYRNWDLNTSSNIENAMSAAKFYNPASPGTLTTADLATGTYGREVYVKGNLKVQIKNNYHIPLKLTVYKLAFRAATSTQATGWYSSAIVDESNGTVTTQKLYKPEEFATMKRMFRFKSKKTKILMPGQTCYSSLYAPWIKYDPAWFDSEASTHQPAFKTQSIFVRIEGVLSHDSTTSTLINDAAAGVDTLYDLEYYCKYDGGLKSKYISSTDAAGTVTTGVIAEPATGNYSFSGAAANS